MSRTLLIDADIPAYHMAVRHQQETAFGMALDAEQAFIDIDEILANWMIELKADKLIVCLTDKENFRYEVLPTYKSKRKHTVRPELLNEIKGYLADEYTSKIFPRLEADDVMGILATHPTLIEGEKIIVSEDKDMRTIPAKVYHPHRPTQGVMEISELDADRFLMWQTICGDTTDGYGGAKGVGDKSPYAEDVLCAEREELWDEVLLAYASKGLTEEDALVQARCARILRAEDYNVETGEIELWIPELLNPKQ